MSSSQRRLTLLLGLVLLPLAMIAGGILIASSSPAGPRIDDTDPVRIGVTDPSVPGPGATTSAAPTTEHSPEVPQFQPDPPAATSGQQGGSRATQPASRPTTQVQPPVRQRPAPAPVPNDDDDDNDSDDDGSGDDDDGSGDDD